MVKVTLSNKLRNCEEALVNCARAINSLYQVRGAYWKHILPIKQTTFLHMLCVCVRQCVRVCVCECFSKVIQARKNLGNWKFAHKNLSLCLFASSSASFHYAIQAGSLSPRHAAAPSIARPQNYYLEHYRDARKLVEVLELFTLISFVSFQFQFQF